MVTEIAMLDVWIPERMTPGTLFPFDPPKANKHDSNPQNSFLGVLACPECGEQGYVTRFQVAGLHSVICGSNQCSAEFYICEGIIAPRKPS